LFQHRFCNADEQATGGPSVWSEEAAVGTASASTPSRSVQAAVAAPESAGRKAKSLPKLGVLGSFGIRATCSHFGCAGASICDQGYRTEIPIGVKLRGLIIVVLDPVW
jgi:hypothetical protein